MDEQHTTQPEPWRQESDDGKLIHLRGSARANGEAKDKILPVIRIAAGKLPAAVAEANRLLAKHSPITFIFGEVLVTLEDVDGRLATVPATIVRVRLELARVARYETMGKTGPSECDPTVKLAATIVSEPGGWRAPVLAGLTEVPILRPDGTVVTMPGYDPVSRLYLHGGPFDPLDDDPHAALAVLKGALAEFPFVKDHHRSAALALLLTSVCRRTLPSAPLFGISAREAGTGKGALAALASIMATGRRGAERPWPNSDQEEQRKAITTALGSARPVLLLDNITEPLDSSPLCVLLTAETWNDRLLGVNKEVNLPTTMLAVATGNNLQVVGDLCRRELPIEMDAGLESPELREFERDLVPWAIENRQRLVSAALTILSCYRDAGSPLPDRFRPLGSFEAWSRLVCGSLMWLGEPDPRDAMMETRAADPKRLLLAKVLIGIKALFGKTWQSAGNIYATARSAGEGSNGADLWSAIEEITMKAKDDKGARIMLGRWFESQKGRVAADLRLECERDTDRKINLWRATCSAV